MTNKMRWITCALLVMVVPCLASALATPLLEMVRVEMNIIRKIENPDLTYDGEGPRRLPGRIDCPVNVTYDESSATFYLMAEDDCTVGYTIYDDMGTQLQTGTVSVIAGQASIPVTGATLTDGCMIELTIGDTTYLGILNP